MARKPEVRLRYRLSQNGGPPFFKSEDVWGLSDHQLLLSHYIAFYESIYELPESERPSDDVIEDDRKLDQWILEWKLKMRTGPEKPGARDNKNWGRGTIVHGE